MKIRRIGRKTFGIVLVLLLLFVTFFVIFQHQRNRQARIEVLTTQLGDFNDYIYYLDALSGTSFAHITPHADSLLSQIMKMQNKKGLRLTLISLDGTVIFDSDFPDCDSLSNHLSRNEVKKALREGKGTDICRNSGTLGRPFFYSATYNKKFSYIVRSSLPYNISLVQALSSDSHFLWYALALLVVMVVVLWRYVRRMDKTLEEREELRQNLQLMEQSEMKNRLTQNIAHELKTPLSSIEGYLETMLDHPEMDAAEREHFLRRCYAQSNRLSNLSRDISTLTADICRNSGTLGRPFFYSATYNKKFSYIVRSSLPYNISLVQALSSDSHFLWYALALLVVMVVVLWRYVRRMDKTLEEREELRQNLQLMEQSEMKNRLTQNIAHELKTPLSSIEGYLETMLDHPEMDAAEREHFLRRCYAQSNRLSNLSRDISTLTELSEGTAILQMEPVNMHDLARDVLEDVTPALKKAKMQAFNKIADDVVVNGDRSLLYSVMRNLTDNAIAYAGEGCSIEVSAVRADNHFYRFTFADNGVGVPSAHLEHLFERFYRVDKGRSRKLGGTGLGLAIVKNAVLQHGGSIEIVNREGGGLQCTFFLKAENDV